MLRIQAGDTVANMYLDTEPIPMLYGSHSKGTIRKI